MEPITKNITKKMEAEDGPERVVYFYKMTLIDEVGVRDDQFDFCKLLSIRTRIESTWAMRRTLSLAS